ncbi:MAG: hypothetical protein GH144_00705 [Clostridia bacterium]|jgi:hypothetical protein|nr:hypothetical protein [Clostridia bacterium]
MDSEKLRWLKNHESQKDELKRLTLENKINVTAELRLSDNDEILISLVGNKLDIRLWYWNEDIKRFLPTKKGFRFKLGKVWPEMRKIWARIDKIYREKFEKKSD